MHSLSLSLSLACRWTKIDDFVILGALPTQPILRTLALEQQVKVTINMCIEFKGDRDYYSGLGVVEHQFKTEDFLTPTLVNIRAAIKVIEEAIRNKQCVYIHCKVCPSFLPSIASFPCSCLRIQHILFAC